MAAKRKPREKVPAPVPRKKIRLLKLAKDLAAAAAAYTTGNKQDAIIETGSALLGLARDLGVPVPEELEVSGKQLARTALNAYKLYNISKSHSSTQTDKGNSTNAGTQTGRKNGRESAAQTVGVKMRESATGMGKSTGQKGRESGVQTVPQKYTQAAAQTLKGKTRDSGTYTGKSDFRYYPEQLPVLELEPGTTLLTTKRKPEAFAQAVILDAAKPMDVEYDYPAIKRVKTMDAREPVYQPMHVSKIKRLPGKPGGVSQVSKLLIGDFSTNRAVSKRGLKRLGEMETVQLYKKKPRSRLPIPDTVSILPFEK